MRFLIEQNRNDGQPEMSQTVMEQIGGFYEQLAILIDDMSSYCFLQLIPSETLVTKFVKAEVELQSEHPLSVKLTLWLMGGLYRPRGIQPPYITGTLDNTNLKQGLLVTIFEGQIPTKYRIYPVAMKTSTMVTQEFLALAKEPFFVEDKAARIVHDLIDAFIVKNAFELGEEERGRGPGG